MTPEEEQYFAQMQEQLQATQTQAQQGQVNQAQASMQQQQQEASMIDSQLDLEVEKEKIRNNLMGRTFKLNEEKGYYEWVDAPSEDYQPLNEFGVHLIMKMLNFYLTKNKLLSNYSEEQINVKMEDFSIELADLIFMKYREMGLDTPEKRKLYPSIVREVQDSVHDAYLRALKGMERSSLRKHMHISESSNQGMAMPKKEGMFSWLKSN